jgi:phosphate transport system protein
MLQNFQEQLHTINQQVIDIAKSILRANQIILDAFEECDSVILSGAKSDLKNINQRTNDIDNEIIKILALFTPEAKDLRLIVSFFKFTNELQRAASNTKSFIKTFEVYCTNIDKDSIKDYAIPLQKATVESLEAIVELLESEEDDAREYFNKVLIAENKTDEIYDDFQDFILQKDKNIEDFSKFTKILNALRKSEKIADRSVDMAYLLLFAKLGGSLGDVEI